LAADWLARDLPNKDLLLGNLLTTTTRMLVVGPTGLGKTMFGLAIAFAMALGKRFLHWKEGRPARVLYVDGEMSRGEMRRRLSDAARRADGVPDGLIILSKEDFEEMPPFNTDAGQKWMDALIAKHGPFDVGIFDNIQALLVGDMKDEEAWSLVLPWVRSLTRRSMAQIWFHHTGHDESKSYGSKAREWQMDTVVLMERIETTPPDLAFMLKFTKARERTPDNYQDFDAVTLRLENDTWKHTFELPTDRRVPQNHLTMLNVLKDAGDEGLTVEEWNTKARAVGIGEKRRGDCLDFRTALQAKNMVHLRAGRWFAGPKPK
jgi:AAA domain-containing protein